jgi:hypothetical protein
MKTINVIFVLLILASFVSANAQGVIKQQKKELSVIVLPFLENERYPYVIDNFRENVMNTFLSKGYNVIKSDSVWAEILSLDLNLANTTNEQVRSIADKIDVDLIITGKVESVHQNQIDDNPYSTAADMKPVALKVFDGHKKSLLIHQREADLIKWGLNAQPNSINNVAEKTIEKLIMLGY